MAKPRQTECKETRDLAFAAYAHMRQLTVLSAVQKKKGTSTEYQFLFFDPPSDEYPGGRWEELQVDFANSESTRFDSSVRSMKKLCKPKITHF